MDEKEEKKKIVEELKVVAGIDDTEDALKLLREDKEKNYLDIGFSNGVWYYGREIGGKEAIITSDRKILRNTITRFKDEKGDIKVTGKNPIRKLFDYDSYIGDIAPRLSPESIKKFIKENYEVDKNEIAEKIRETINYYMGFDLDETTNADYVQTCWILGTHCYPIFYWYPHLLFNGPQQSGKTKNAFVDMMLCFGGFDLGASAGVTPAQIYRTLEGNRGTIIIDEFEQESGKKSDTQMLVNQIMNASAGRDAYIIRTEKIRGKWKAWKFPIFCPKISCNISGINLVSLTRYIVFHMLKTQNKVKLKRKPWTRKEQEKFKPIREDCQVLMLQGSWKEIQEIYENLNVDLYGREEDNWLPILAVAKWLGDEWYARVFEYIKNYKGISIETSDLEEELFLTLLDRVDDRLGFYLSKDIAGYMGDTLSSYKNPQNWVGRILTKYKFKKEHKAGGNGYFLSKKLVEERYKSYFNPDYSSDSSYNSYNSNSSDSSGNTPKSEVSELLNYHMDKKSDKIDTSELSESDKERQLRAGGNI
jgi:hypothetical protein